MGVDQIGTKGLVDCSVAAADIADGTITNAKLAGSIANAKLSNSSITVNGQSISLGASGSVPPVQWQSVVASDGSTVTTMVAGRGYFINNTSAAGIVKLPASASAGDIVSIKDYAGNFGTNNLTIQRNSHKIQGVAADSTISTDRASVSLVYVDATKGWLYTNESNVATLVPTFISATGGTVTTTGDFKVHTFTGDGNFVVASLGNPQGSTKVDYLVIAGGGGGGQTLGGGGGAGGSRTSFPSPGCNAGAFPVSAQTYPITVGAGGQGASNQVPQDSGNGSNSVFSTITSAGGGGGGSTVGDDGSNGGSGGGGSYGGGIGTGNTPPVSPSQGNNGGTGSQPAGLAGGLAGGGGGHGAVGEPANTAAPGNTAGDGGAGSANSITGSPVTRAGGGGGGGSGADSTTGGAGAPGGGGTGANAAPAATAGTANTGGGGGGGSGGNAVSVAGAGGSGVVIIRYKFQ